MTPQMPSIKEIENLIKEAKYQVALSMRELRKYQSLLKTVKRLENYMEETK